MANYFECYPFVEQHIALAITIGYVHLRYTINRHIIDLRHSQ
jgi:hypothetical protein